MTLELPVQGGAAIVTIVVPLSDFSGRILLGGVLNRSPHTPRELRSCLGGRVLFSLLNGVVIYGCGKPWPGNFYHLHFILPRSREF